MITITLSVRLILLSTDISTRASSIDDLYCRVDLYMNMTLHVCACVCLCACVYVSWFVWACMFMRCGTFEMIWMSLRMYVCG